MTQEAITTNPESADYLLVLTHSTGRVHFTLWETTTTLCGRNLMDAQMFAALTREGAIEHLDRMAEKNLNPCPKCRKALAEIGA